MGARVASDPDVAAPRPRRPFALPRQPSACSTTTTRMRTDGDHELTMTELKAAAEKINRKAAAEKAERRAADDVRRASQIGVVQTGASGEYARARESRRERAGRIDVADEASRGAAAGARERQRANRLREAAAREAAARRRRDEEAAAEVELRTWMSSEYRKSARERWPSARRTRRGRRPRRRRSGNMKATCRAPRAGARRHPRHAQAALEDEAVGDAAAAASRSRLMRPPPTPAAPHGSERAAPRRRRGGERRRGGRRFVAVDRSGSIDGFEDVDTKFYEADWRRRPRRR